MLYVLSTWATTSSCMIIGPHTPELGHGAYNMVRVEIYNIVLDHSQFSTSIIYTFSVEKQKLAHIINPNVKHSG